MSNQFLFISISIFGYGLGSFFYKLAGQYNLHPLMVCTVSTSLFFILIPLAFVFLKFDHSLNVGGVSFALLGGLMMVVGNLGFMFALRHGAAGQITAMTALYPAVTILLSMAFLGEQVTIRKVTGVIVVGIAFLLLG